jgi:type II secretory pathway component PulK
MKNSSRQGFAMATAILLIPIATVAMMSIGMLAAADYRRTASTAEGAQLRQLLLAASIDARSHLVDLSSPRSWQTALPTDLATAGAKVETTMTLAGQTADLTITATLGPSHAAEQMRFNHSGDRWLPVSAELTDSSD